MQARIYPSPLGYHLYDLWVEGKKEIEGESFGVVSAVQSSLWGNTRGADITADEIADQICKKRNLIQGTRISPLGSAPPGRSPEVKSKRRVVDMSKTCQICGKPRGNYPNWVIGQGLAAHIGCLADDYQLATKLLRKLLDDGITRGTFGPWCDDWEGSWAERHWGDQ